jgi:hypothetical protein
MTINTPISALLGLLLVAGTMTLGGCGKSDVPRHSLAGTVTFRGKPVPIGLIVFEPDVARGNHGPQGYAEILDGEYKTEQFGKGAVTGSLKVLISGFPPADGSAGNPDVPLFPSYSTHVEVTEETTTLDFDVPSPAR